MTSTASDERTALICVARAASGINSEGDKPDCERNDDDDVRASSSSSRVTVPDSKLGYVKSILKLAAPNLVTFYSIFSIVFVAAAFLGRRSHKNNSSSSNGTDGGESRSNSTVNDSEADLQVRELSGFLLGTAFNNCFCFASLTGLILALDTLLPQAVGTFGSAHHPAVFVIMQRVFAIALYWAFFVLVPLMVAAPHYLPQLLPTDDAAVAGVAAQTLQFGAATIVPYLCEEALQSFLVGALDHPYVVTAGAVTAAASNVALQYVTQKYWEGASVAPAVVSWTLTEIVMVTVTFAVGYGVTRGEAFQGWWTRLNVARNFFPRCDDDAQVAEPAEEGTPAPSTTQQQQQRRFCGTWSAFLSHCVPTMFAMLTEWSVFEALTILAATVLDKHGLAGHVIVSQLSTSMFPLVLSCGISLGVHIGKFTGSGEPDAAKMTAKIGAGLFLLEFCVTCTLMVLGRDTLPRVFTDHEAVIAQAALALPIAAISHVADCTYFFCGCVLRAQGRQALSLGIAVVGYWLFGIPSAYLFSTHVGLFTDDPAHRIVGLWAGVAVGQGVAAVAGVIAVLNVSWEQTEEMAEDLVLDPKDLQ